MVRETAHRFFKVFRGNTMSIAEFLGLIHKKTTATAGAGEADTVRKIVAALDQMDPDKARFIAAFTFVLCRVARADLKITAGEIQIMERIVMERSGLPEEQAILLVQMAKTQSVLFGGTEDFIVTREFNRIATREEKLALLDCLFAVAADEMISVAEENEISQIASELQLELDDVVRMRSRYNDLRAVMKKPADAPPKS
jgi:uncharacterized tellurite resistance protein B-like protein